MTISLQSRSGAMAGAVGQSHGDNVQRFDTHQRIQHFLMMSSFVVLVATGLPQRFSELGISQWWVAWLGGLEQTRTIHRTAGLVMVFDCFYHVGYLFFRIGVQGKTTPLQMIPTLQDARDAVHMTLYFFGVEDEKPRFGRFSYLEKFDYWAVFWGIAVIGGSGVVLMFHVAATKVLPGQVLPLAEVLHGDEAILATGWILIVHMFNAHLAPWVFPFNPAIFTGKLSRERYEEDHPLEYELLIARERAERERAREELAGQAASLPADMPESRAETVTGPAAAAADPPAAGPPDADGGDRSILPETGAVEPPSGPDTGSDAGNAVPDGPSRRVNPGEGEPS